MVKLPEQLLLGMRNGKDRVVSVFAGRAKGGVVNITVLSCPHVRGCRGPAKLNFSTIIWVAFVHDITTALTVNVPPTATVAGENVIDT